MNDTKDLIREIQEHTAAHGGENTATHLLVQAVMALQRQADEMAAIGAGGVSGPLMGGAALAAPQQAAPRKIEWWNPMKSSNTETALQMAAVIAHRDAMAAPQQAAPAVAQALCATEQKWVLQSPAAIAELLTRIDMDHSQAVSVLGAGECEAWPPKRYTELKELGRRIVEQDPDCFPADVLAAFDVAAPQQEVPAQPDDFGSAEHWKEKAQYWAGVAHRLRGEALRGEPVDGIIQPPTTSPQAAQAPQPGHVLVPVEPEQKYLRPFHSCPPEELELAWQAMVTVARVAAPKAPELAAPALAALFREALAWGMTYGPAIPAHQWDDMRESMVAQYVSRAALAAPQQEPDPFSLACEVLRIYGGGPHTVTAELDIAKPETLAGLKFLESVLKYAWSEGAKAAQTPQQAAPAVAVHGDVLPPVGSRVFIRHGRDDDSHACTVTGYYAWGDLKGDKRLHRLFVRLVYEGTEREQARMLCDCYPTAEAALAETAPQQEVQEPTNEMYRAAQKIVLPYDDDGGTIILNTSQIRAIWQAMIAAAPKAPQQATTAMPSEIALMEKAARRVGITSLLNHGAASCAYSEGCAGVSQEHLLAYTREIALHCAVALAAPQQAAPASTSITLDFKQATELLEMFGGEACEVTLMSGDGHSGRGIYAMWAADPEGAVYLGETDEDAAPQPSAQVVPDCLTCNDHGAVGNILTAEPCPDCTNAPQPEAQAIREAISHFRLMHWADEDGGLGLADALAQLYGDEGIGRASEELDMLADAIASINATSQPAQAQAEAAVEAMRKDAELLDWLDQNIFHREMNEWDAVYGGRGDQHMWVLFAPKGVQGTARNIIAAALAAQGGV